MSTQLHKELHDLRPPLRKVAPLSYWITVAYVIMNIIIGLSLAIAFDSHRVVATLLIVNNITTYQFWGLIFILLAAGQWFSIFKNEWKWTKKSLLAGVIVKSAWAIALLVRALTSTGTLLIALPWVTLAMIQALTIIFFLPPVYDFRKRGDEDHESDNSQ